MAFYKLSNPDQNENNFIKLKEKDLGCCGNIADACRNVISFATYALIGMVTILCKGKEYTIDIGGGTDADGASDAICDKIEKCVSSGGFGAQMEAENNDGGGVLVQESNGAVVVCLDTDIEILRATDTAGADVPVTKLCEKIELCKYQVAVAIADAPADAEATVLAAGVTVTGAVTTEDDADQGLHIITFSTVNSVDGVVILGMTPVNCGCTFEWSNADGTPFSKLEIKKGKLKSTK